MRKRRVLPTRPLSAGGKPGSLTPIKWIRERLLYEHQPHQQNRCRSHFLLVSHPAEQKEDLERQMQRLKDYAASKGYQVTKMVSELASGLNDRRPKLMKVLTDASVGIVVIEHRDRLTRFGFNYIEQLMQMQGRRLEVLFPNDTDTDLEDDFIAVITSMASRISGRRTSQRRAETMKQCVEQVMKAEDAS